MAEILTEEGRRLLEKGKFLVGLFFSLSLQISCTIGFIRSIDSPRNDDIFGPYAFMVGALMLIEIVGGKALQKISIAFGKGMSFGGWMTPLLPFIVLWALPAYK